MCFNTNIFFNSLEVLWTCRGCINQSELKAPTMAPRIYVTRAQITCPIVTQSNTNHYIIKHDIRILLWKSLLQSLKISFYRTFLLYKCNVKKLRSFKAPLLCLFWRNEKGHKTVIPTNWCPIVLYSLACFEATCQREVLLAYRIHWVSRGLLCSGCYASAPQRI